jgi:hypothetical protein
MEKQMNKILLVCATMIGLVFPAICATGFYFCQVYELFALSVLIIGFILGVVTYHYYMILNARRMERNYKDSLIRQSQATDELAVIFQKELDKSGFSDIEVVITDEGRITIKNEKEVYVEDNVIQQIYSDALRIFNNRMLRR